MLWLRHSVVVQNRDSGDQLGRCTCYHHDMRLTTLQPPYFLKPAANLWRVLNNTDRWPGEHEVEGLGVPQDGVVEAT